MVRAAVHRSGALVVAACVMSGCLAVVPTVSGALTPAGAGSPDFAGDYTFFTSGGGQDALVLSTDGSYQMSDGDQGDWASMADAVVLSGRSNALNSACLYLGTASAAGINTRRRPGPSDCDGNRATHWYAVRTSASSPRPTGAASPLSGPRATGSRVQGKYRQTDTLPDAPAAILTIKANGLDIQDYPDSDYNFGHWARQDGVIAFAVESSQFGDNAGCIFIGDLSTGGINASGTPGVVDCGGSLYSWSATKLNG
jgi:hypothetical protein